MVIKLCEKKVFYSVYRASGHMGRRIRLNFVERMLTPDLFAVGNLFVLL